MGGDDHERDAEAKAALVRSNEMLAEVLEILASEHDLGALTCSLASTVEGTVVSLYDFIVNKYKD